MINYHEWICERIRYIHRIDTIAQVWREKESLAVTYLCQHYALMSRDDLIAETQSFLYGQAQSDDSPFSWRIISESDEVLASFLTVPTVAPISLLQQARLALRVARAKDNSSPYKWVGRICDCVYHRDVTTAYRMALSEWDQALIASLEADARCYDALYQLVRNFKNGSSTGNSHDIIRM